MLSSHLRLRTPSGLFPSGSLPDTKKAPRASSITVLLTLLQGIISGDEQKSGLFIM